MALIIQNQSTRPIVPVILVTAILCASCAMRPWRPTNVGHETGTESTPLLVSHLPEKNQWTLARTKPHNIFQRVLCFNYVCRRLIGRNKLRQAISLNDFKKQIAKNAKKGAYKNMTPAVPAGPVIKNQKKDSIAAARKNPPTRENVTPVLPTPILKADSLITLSEFLFEFDSYKLKGKHYSQLDSLSKFLLAHPTLEVSVTGHTDNTGNEKHNVTLSMHRAETVAHYLTNKGVSDEKIFFEGFGSSRPISGNETEDGRRKNRRVEILIQNPKEK